MSTLKLIPKALDNIIHPTAIVHPSVKIGVGNYIGPYCVIGQNVVIGDKNRFEGFCSIGTPPEHRSYWHGSNAAVVIGNECIIREYVAINSGTEQDTILGNKVNCLKSSYIAHDCHLEDGVTLSGNAAMGGNCYIFQGANIGLNVSIHQFSVIGHYSMLGMGSVVTKKSLIEPLKVYVGVPARYLKINQYAYDRHEISEDDVRGFQEQFRLKTNN